MTDAVDDERVAESIAWSSPDVPTDTCGVCGADLSGKAGRWVVVGPGGAWCETHVRDVR